MWSTEPGATGGGRGIIMSAAQSWPGGTSVVVAHQDDDLLFISPDLLSGVGGGYLQTIFVTAGDGGKDISYVVAREMAAQAAYAEMRGVANAWTSSDAGVAGASVVRQTLTADPRISLVFLRLPDGNVIGSGFVRYGYQNLEALLGGTQSRIQAVDDSASYNADELLTALVELMGAQGASEIRTLNYAAEYGDGDHSDHHSVAFLTQSANQYLRSDRTIRAYIGYPVQNMAANVTGNLLAGKSAAFDQYAALDPGLNGTEFGWWGARMYTSDASTFLPVHADAGQPQIVALDSTVQLDGNASSDGTYDWTQTDGPAEMLLSDPDAQSPTFVASTAGRFTFQLTTSQADATDTATTTVVVRTADSVNLAQVPGLTVSASTENTPSGQTAGKVVDGVADGYPGDPTREWATIGEKAGAWILLAWASEVTATAVVLYDRPNGADQVLGGRLDFSDGTSVQVPALVNDGSPTFVEFEPRRLTSVRFTVTATSPTTENIGLAEFEVYGEDG